MKIILCGYHWTGCKALQILLEQNHEVFVFTHESPYHVPSLIDYCKEKGIPFSTEDISKSNLPFTPDIICSIYYRNKIAPHVIKSCNGKIFNLHPSLLPKYRGCSSLTWALINGEKKTGFTYHYINNNVDAGNIILQKELPIEDFDTQETLYTRTMFTAMNHFEEALKLVQNNHPGTPQTGESSIYNRGCPHKGKINPDWKPEYIKRFIRAMTYPPYPVATFENKEINTYEDYEKNADKK